MNATAVTPGFSKKGGMGSTSHWNWMFFRRKSSTNVNLSPDEHENNRASKLPFSDKLFDSYA